MCIRDRNTALTPSLPLRRQARRRRGVRGDREGDPDVLALGCLLYTSDAADERSSVDLGGRRIIKKKNNIKENMTLDRVKNKHRTSKQQARTANNVSTKEG